MIIKEYEISKTDEFALLNDLLDIQQWVNDAIQGKIASCKKRMLQEWVPKLLADPNVKTMPATEDEIISLITARVDYKHRVARDQEEEAKRK